MHVGSNSLTRDEPRPPALGVWSLSHCATSEVPGEIAKMQTWLPTSDNRFGIWFKNVYFESTQVMEIQVQALHFEDRDRKSAQQQKITRTFRF